MRIGVCKQHLYNVKSLDVFIFPKYFISPVTTYHYLVDQTIIVMHRHTSSPHDSITKN